MANSKPLLAESFFAKHSAPFRECVVSFLKRRGKEITLPQLGNTRCFFVGLSDGTFLHVYEEIVDVDHATCDSCRIIGIF